MPVLDHGYMVTERVDPKNGLFTDERGVSKYNLRLGDRLLRQRVTAIRCKQLSKYYIIE